MVIPEIIRNYEVSIWTLQDSFITILKQSNLENMEKIQEPKITLKDDGESNFSFKIPMYILQGDKWIENPIWYTTHNGNIIANMRKIKVIFNKQTQFEKVFEFIILKVTEEHEGKSKFCSVECESLAFHELGKQGYNIALSSDIAQLDYEAWLNGEINEEPILNIDYWVTKVLKNTDWEYLICMDWSSQDGVITFENDNQEIELVDNIRYMNDIEYRAQVDNYRITNGLRDKQKIYRDSYISSWNISNEVLSAATEITDLNELEFKTCVEGSESNRYNLLQSIAEAFKVFCRFEYKYDNNYHIIGRRVIFYNNFIGESGEILDFNYGYNTQNILREMDSNDLITKMYVKSLKDTGVLTGEIYLSDSEANKTLENYLMNFDYLYNIGTITQEQYDEISLYNTEIRKLNNEINRHTLELNFKEAQLPQIQARRKTAEDSLQQDAARLAEADDYLRGIVGNSVTKYTKDNPYIFTIIHGSNIYYSEISFKGIKRNTLKLFKEQSCITEVTRYNIEEKDGNIIRIKYLNDAGITALTNVWATFEYDLSSPYKIIQQIYSNKQNKDLEDFSAAKEEEQEFEDRINELTQIIEEKVLEKEELISSFERIMGPALREGTWQPEKDYENYQENKIYSAVNNLLNISTMSSNEKVSFIWDNKSFEEENKNSYSYGVDGITLYYPCLKLDEEMIGTLTKEDLSNIFLVYEDNYGVLPSGDPRSIHYLQLNTDDGCRYAFLKDKTNSTSLPIPVLMITGVLSFLPEEENSSINDPVERRIDAKYRADEKIKNNVRISKIVGYNERQGTLNEVILIPYNKIVTQIDNKWIPRIDLNKYEIVFPRFQVNNKFFIQNTPEQRISKEKNGVKEFLKENEDYYTLYRDQKWYVTLKTETILENLSAIYSFYYALSTAANAMYLDAVDIMKENAFPKTSYSITPLAIDKKFMLNAYDHLGQLAHINDDELKFENVQGYISEVNLDLDKPWEDTYVIKNYKTKFEDIFSSIVAQTEQMKKNSTVIGMAANLLTSEGMLEKENLIKSLLNGDIQSIIENFSASKNSIIDLKSSDASSDDLINKIINGEQGLNFGASETIERVILNNQRGLIIQGRQSWLENNQEKSQSAWFQVNHEAMGFFHLDSNNVQVSDLYYENGNLKLAGIISAKGGDIGGWLIGANEIHRNTSGTLYTQIGGNDYAIFAGNESVTNAPFSVKYDGTLIAKKGYIGGWTIDSDSIFTGVKTDSSSIRLSSTNFTRSINNTSRNNLRLAFGTNLGIASDGTLYAADATVTGNITATSLTVGTGNNLLTYTSSNGLIVKGNITATSGAISGTLTISGCLTTNINRTVYNSTSQNGITISSGGIGGHGGDGDFTMTTGGKLTATGATITGNITATSGTFTGTINARSGTIGSANAPKITIGSTGDTSSSTSRIYSGSKSSKNSTNDGFYIGTDGISLGAYNSSLGHNPFEVSTSGLLYATNANISGTIKATKVDALELSSDAFGWQDLTPCTEDGVLDDDSFLVRYGRLGNLIIVQGSFVAARSFLSGGTISTTHLPVKLVADLLPTFVGTFRVLGEDCYGIVYGEFLYGITGHSGSSGGTSAPSEIVGILYITDYIRIKGTIPSNANVQICINFTYCV